VKIFKLLVPAVLFALAPQVYTHAHAKPIENETQLVEIFKEMVEINTVHPNGDNTLLANKVAARLKAGGFDPKDVEVIVPPDGPKKGNLIARYRVAGTAAGAAGTPSKKPMLLLAHIDVVDARKEDWSDGLDPFKLTEKDGYYYGRGVLDDKAMAAIFTMNLLRMKAEGFKPKRDIILALTADEEGGSHNGVSYLLKHHRSLIDADFALNEGGGGVYRNGKPFAQNVQVSEKMFLNFDFEATNSGGHSSVPARENAIYDLAGAMSRLSQHEFPVSLNFVTRMNFSRLATVESGELAESMSALSRNEATPAQLKTVSAIPRYNAALRTTCVATRAEAGHADNALPQRARATVNCRLLPKEDPEFVRSELQKLAGNRVKVTARGEPRASEPSDTEHPAYKTIARVSESMWPGTAVIPIMSTGATDGSRLRNDGIPTFGTSGVFVEFGEVRIHGKDERIPIRSLHQAQEYLYRLVKALAALE
jgi:acetylornithine deacetylase/succinyl-diaminopimelate desuccinylase-like protein